MKRRILLIVALTVGAAGGACSTAATESVTPPATVKLRVGEGAAIKDTPWTVIFDSVVSDSRCPLGVFCIWGGEALLALELASPLADPRPEDSPHFTVGLTPAVVEGFKFSIEEVQPIKRQNETIDPKSYFVKLRIEAASPP